MLYPFRRLPPRLHGFLKDNTSGTAAAVIRGNTGGVGLESWRRLHAQFNPKTIRGTLQSQHLEQHPRGAKKLSELPGCLAEWERNLRRCIAEGRVPPDDA